MLAKMIAAEEEERKMHIKAPANRDVSGFKHQKSESSLRGNPGGPAEAWTGLYETDDQAL